MDGRIAVVAVLFRGSGGLRGVPIRGQRPLGSAMLPDSNLPIPGHRVILNPGGR
jgi:hypothetical protein